MDQMSFLLVGRWSSVDFIKWKPLHQPDSKRDPHLGRIRECGNEEADVSNRDVKKKKEKSHTPPPINHRGAYTTVQYSATGNIALLYLILSVVLLLLLLLFKFSVNLCLFRPS